MHVNNDPRTVIETGLVMVCVVLAMLMLGAGLALFNSQLLGLALLLTLVAILLSLSGKPLIET